MSGLENMKRQILDEANHSAEEQISKARTKAEEILREAREQMEEQSAVMAKKSEDETKDYAQRIASSSEMQRKQALLQAKQEVIQEVLNKAYQQVLHLEPESYFEMLQKLLETYALPQEGTIYFSAADLARMPQKFEDVIEQTAQKKGILWFRKNRRIWTADLCWFMAGLKKIVRSGQCSTQSRMNCRMLYRKYYLYRAQPFFAGSKRKQEGGIRLE